MRGKYYLRHTINHSVDNRYRINSLNDNYRSMIKQNAIEYLQKKDIPIGEKVTYLKGLTHDVYRHGTKYKYNCNLSPSDISSIIISLKDTDLHQAYFGKTIEEYNSQNIKTSIVICVVLFIILFFALHACGLK